ncbi:hypothetical protein JYU34_014946 [Plutella xylostella]|uniref:Uncharacterized protein n=1 Tax=Plutella xylostella TaxID=51655 RepID=A0ABQ7Q5X3_PLUXY|nr:hypothetical protein JYU34_014946 [Plutella xylostella]
MSTYALHVRVCFIDANATISIIDLANGKPCMNREYPAQFDCITQCAYIENQAANTGGNFSSARRWFRGVTL